MMLFHRVSTDVYYFPAQDNRMPFPTATDPLPFTICTEGSVRWELPKHEAVSLLSVKRWIPQTVGL
jgi:hypothetical protein